MKRPLHTFVVEGLFCGYYVPMNNGSPMQRFLLDALSDGVTAVQSAELSRPLEGSGMDGSAAGCSLSAAFDAPHGRGGME